MVAYFKFIIRFKWPILAAFLLATIIAGYSMSQGIIATSLGKMFLGESPHYQSYLSRVDLFGGGDAVIISFEEKQPISPASHEKLVKATSLIASIPEVKKVTSFLDVQHISGSEDTLTINSYVDEILDDPEDAQRLFEQLRSDPLAKGLLISADGKHLAAVVELDVKADIPAEDAPRILGEVVEAFVKAGYQKDEMHLVGFPANTSAVISETQFNLKRLFPIVCVVLLIAVWVMFRRLWPVALTMTVAFIAVIWTMGFSVLLEKQVSAFASMVPAVILIVSFSDVIHLCSAYLLELGRGFSKEEAILASGTDVGKACLLTSITTFLGFVALSFVPVPVFRHLGIVFGFGVAVALLIAMTLAPIFFSIIPRPKPWRRGTAGKIQGGLDRLLTATAKLTAQRPWLVVGAFILIIGISIFGLTKLKIETDFAKRLAYDHPTRVDGRYFQAHFDGATALDVFIEVDEKKDLLDPEIFAKIGAFQDALLQMPEVAHVFSLVDLIEIMHRELTVGENGDRYPTTRPALAQYLLLFEMSGGEDLDRLIDSDRRTMKLSLQLPGEAVRETYETGVAIKGLAREMLGDSVDIEISGLLYLMGEWLDEIIAGQRRGLLFAMFSIAIAMMLGLRSIRVGLWSMIPNVLPLLVLGGYLGLFWDQVDSDALAIAMIAIGIGVDDTIHFLMRFRIESRRQDNIQDAIERTFHFSGRGIIITSIILVTGFSPFALSDYFSMHIMGTLLPMTLIVALLADLLFVPALASLGAIRFKKPTA